MTWRRLPLAMGLALLAGGGLASIALTRPDPLPDPLPDLGVDLPAACSTCDARAASKKRSREALQSKAAEAE